MLLWTIQHINAYNKMNKCGTLRAENEYIYSYFKGAYKWLSKQMTQRIGPAPEGVDYPVWAWYQWEGKRKRPDMRFHGRGWCPEKGTPIVLITIDVSDQNVLLSDFDDWHIVLNDGVYDITEKYDRDFSEEEKIKSWEYIFDVNGEFVKRDINIKPSIQATMWEIKK